MIIVKRLLLVFLALLVISGAVLGALAFAYNDGYYYAHGQMLQRNPFKTVFYDKPIWEHYSINPDWFEPERTRCMGFEEYLEEYSDEICVTRATFVNEDKSSCRSEYLFNVTGWDKTKRVSMYNEAYLIYKDIPENIFYYSYQDSNSYYIGTEIYTTHHSTYTLMLSYYDVRYEKGKEYLLLSLPEYMRENLSIFSGGKFYYIAPLDEEYPYIEVYPGAIRYDATYFGAETKDVTKEEFVELVTAYADSL